MIAVLLALSGIEGWFQAWRMVFELGGAGILGGIVFQAVFLIGIYMVTHVLWIRASDISEQPASEFTVIPIVSIVLRMVGEVYACLLSVLGVGGCILILFAGDNRLMDMLPGVGLLSGLIFGLVRGMDSSFLAALLFLISCLITAVFALVVFYLLAETQVVLVDIARNIRIMRRYYEQPSQSTQGD